MADVGWFADLLEESLSGVGFFADYVQLHFDLNPLLNVYSPMRVTVDGTTAETGEADFPRALLAQMQKRVGKVTIEPEESISIHFRDGSVLSFATAQKAGLPEAFTLFTNAGVHEE
ncbi:MAG TPA: hypothetical protein VKG23_19360 [Thermoanaerobaculia bacterium]|jgi:hypothetical protein|nr:hypothetical protein [Thermoanaerobaculia bacterium]